MQIILTITATMRCILAMYRVTRVSISCLVEYNRPCKCSRFGRRDNLSVGRYLVMFIDQEFDS